MWTDHLLFWVVLIWMLFLATLAFFAVRMLLRDEDDADPEPPSPNGASPPPATDTSKAPSPPSQP